MLDDDSRMLAEGALQYGLSLSPGMVDRLFSYRALLADWNSRMNLISQGDLARFVTYHLLDSLKITSCLPIPSGSVIMDFGSGAGLPGIPLGIVCDPSRLFLVDSRLKRCIFLEATVQSLGLSSAKILRSRAEDIPSSYNGACDFVVTRATTSLSAFYDLTARFLRPGGSLISIKGEGVENEIADLRRVVKKSLFHIEVCRPPEVAGVRTGTVVVITSGRLVNTPVNRV